MVSVKLMSAMPSAHGHISCASVRSGRRNDGRPEGTAPTTDTPRVCSAQMAVAPMAAPSTISGAGHLGLTFSISASTAIVPKPMARR